MNPYYDDFPDGDWNGVESQWAHEAQEHREYEAWLDREYEKQREDEYFKSLEDTDE